MTDRTATVSRKTRETDITCTIALDGRGVYDIDTGIGFFDHMLSGFARHGLFDLTLHCKGDLEVDCHHTIEDCGIVLGEAIRKALGDKKAIKRFGSVILPMDEALILCAIDLSGRPYFRSDLTFTTDRIGGMDTEMVREFFYSLSYGATSAPSRPSARPWIWLPCTRSAWTAPSGPPRAAFDERHRPRRAVFRICTDRMI